MAADRAARVGRVMPVYFVQAGDDGPIKIGFAVNAIRRLHELQVNSPARIRPLGVIAGDRTTERSLHRRFADDRVSGEWFRPSASLLSLIETAAPLVRPTKAQKRFDRPIGRRWEVSEILACAGSPARLAQIAGVDHSSIYGWKRAGRVPYARARSISEALGIPLHEIRPDVWRTISADSDLPASPAESPAPSRSPITTINSRT